LLPNIIFVGFEFLFENGSLAFQIIPVNISAVQANGKNEKDFRRTQAFGNLFQGINKANQSFHSESTI
jgi:hypothetical protein